MTEKMVDYYMSLPYPILLTPDEDSWLAEIPLLDGCMSDGDTIEEAIKNLREAQELWIEVALEDGDEIPEPLPVAH